MWSNNFRPAFRFQKFTIFDPLKEWTVYKLYTNQNFVQHENFENFNMILKKNIDYTYYLRKYKLNLSRVDFYFPKNSLFVGNKYFNPIII